MYAQVSSMLSPKAIDQKRRNGVSLHDRALSRGRRGRLCSWLSGRSSSLLELKEIEASCRIHTRSATAARTVPIQQICGSEGRAREFDRDFNPRKRHTQERWLGIAVARQQGKALPSVSLVQVGDLYFVRDGHHRISVARALGQQNIEARVTVWQVEGPLPWERGAPASELALQPA
jgi:hypothetical protein